MPVTFAQIEPTTRCNFTCGFCVGRRMAQRDLAWATFETFLAAHPDLRHVELQGEGEPLLHPRFFDMADACRARGIRVSIITNGSLLTPDRVERLLASGTASIHVSLESRDAETFERIRGGRFAKVEAGLRRLIERREALGLRAPGVGLAVTVLKDTITDFGGIVDLYRTLGLDGGISVQPLQGMSDYAAAYGEELLNQQIGPAEAPKIAAMRREAAGLGGPRTFYAALFAGPPVESRGCPWLDRGAYLAADGHVAPCCFVKDTAAALGRIGEESEGEISARRAAMNAELLSGRTPKPCWGCGTAAAIVRSRAVSRAPHFSLTAPTLLTGANVGAEAHAARPADSR